MARSAGIPWRVTGVDTSNGFIELEGVCNLGHPDGGDRADMWKYTPHYPLNTQGEHWQRMNPPAFPATRSRPWKTA